MVAIPKPNKSLDNVWSYRSISLLCVPYKILERLIHSCVKPIIDPLLPPEQAGFRRGRTALKQATRISQGFEDCSEDKKKASAVFIDFTAAYDIVWHRGLACKLLRFLPDKHMVKMMMMDLVYNRSFTLTNGRERKSRLRRLKNGIPQGSVLAPHLFNIYINDLPPTTSKLYGYADDLAIVHSALNGPHWKTLLTWRWQHYHHTYKLEIKTQQN